MGTKKRPKKETKKKNLSGSKPMERVDLYKQLAYLKENKRKIRKDRELYYNELLA